MGYTKTIVCLANSRKPPSGGRCIAGREVSNTGFGDWIRPVSARPTEEVSEEERRYQNGSDPRVLDVVTIEMDRPHPRRHQQENHVIDAEYYWTKERTLSWRDIQKAVDGARGPLWVNESSSYNGILDRVAEDRLDEIDRSLYLVKPVNGLMLTVQPEGPDPATARRKVRATFEWSGYTYCIAVTDPVIEREYFAMGNGTYAVEEAILCVSLGEVYNGYAYKLAAAVIRP